MPYSLLADAVLLLHLSLVVFVVGGLGLIVAGNLLTWRWVNNLSFRLTHLAAITVVVAESWLGMTCPLTRLESWLRTAAGVGGYVLGQGFIEYWVHRVLFFEAPAWVFVSAYTVFGLLVVAVWWRFPPNRRSPGNAGGR